MRLQELAPRGSRDHITIAFGIIIAYTIIYIFQHLHWGGGLELISHGYGGPILLGIKLPLYKINCLRSLDSGRLDVLSKSNCSFSFLPIIENIAGWSF